MIVSMCSRFCGRGRWPLLIAAVMVVTACGGGPPVLRDPFDGPDGLIAAEGHPATDGSPWLMTSGSLYRRNGYGWTGRPDGGERPGSTGSAVFRMVSVERGFGDVTVSMRLRVERMGETRRTPDEEFDGAHVWVRYRSDRELYAVSVDRRDDKMIIKKKCPGGDDNGGTYYELTEPTPGPLVFGAWQEVSVTARDLPDGSVEITGTRDGRTMRAIDRGVGCTPLTGTGGVGLRGDNSELWFDNIAVTPS
jgi:hypothetical protein